MSPLALTELHLTFRNPADRVIEIAVVRERAGVATTTLDTLVRPDDARFGNAHIRILMRIEFFSLFHSQSGQGLFQRGFGLFDLQFGIALINDRDHLSLSDITAKVHVEL